MNVIRNSIVMFALIAPAAFTVGAKEHSGYGH